MNKPQRIKITERGWTNFTGHFGGVEFKGSVSVEMVDPIMASRLGSILRIQLIDTDEQAGAAAQLQRMQETTAEVTNELPRGEVAPVVAEQAAEVQPEWTREMLEAEADARGIAGLRVIADKFGVKGRGIVELIDEIMQAQAVLAAQA